MYNNSYLQTHLNKCNFMFKKFGEMGLDTSGLAAKGFDGMWAHMEDGKKRLLLTSYSYLGLNGHPRIEEAVRKATEKFGTGTNGVRCLTGTLDLHNELEHKIARLTNSEDAVVFSSGYLTNCSAISAFLGKDGIAVYDQYAHRSLQDGIKISGAVRAPFHHNDMDDLEQCLRKAGDAAKLVIVDGVYSMEGDIAPLPQIIPLCRKYNAAIMVDEAHSIGAIGKTGRGVQEHFGLAPHDIDIKMGSLSKAVPSIGGYIAGSKDLCFTLRKGGSSWWFTGASSPADTASALAALEILENEPERVARLHEGTARYKNEVEAMGFNTLNSPSTVIPVIFKPGRDVDFNDTMQLAGVIIDLGRMVSDLLEEGLWVMPIFYPAVPKESSRLRTTITAGHTDSDIDFALSVLRKVGKKHGQI